MENAMLEKIDKSLEAIVGGHEELRERLKGLEEKHDEVTARVLAVDEQLRSQEAWREEVERRFASMRYRDGSDQLLNALPEDVRQWIPRVRMLKGGAFLGMDETGEIVRRPEALARLGQKDPVLYVACGAWLQARIKAALAVKSGHPQRASEWNARAQKLADALGGFDPRAKAALQEDTANEGGDLVPTILESMIGWLMKEASVVRMAGATVLQMTSKTHNLPKLDNDFTVHWTDEEGTITDSAPSAPFSQGALTAKKQTGLVTVSIELIQDNIVNLMDFVMAHLLQQVGRAEDLQALEGDGTVFTGLFAASGVNSVAGGSNALSEDEVRKLIFGGEHATTVENGVIFCHPWFIRDAIGLTTGNAGQVWLPYMLSGALRTKPNIFGVPAFMTSTIAKDRGTGSNETTAYHGDPRYLIIGDRIGTQFDVNPWSETEFKKGQVLLRLIRRIGILVWVPAYFTKLTAVTV